VRPTVTTFLVRRDGQISQPQRNFGTYDSTRNEEARSGDFRVVLQEMGNKEDGADLYRSVLNSKVEDLKHEWRSRKPDTIFQLLRFIFKHIKYLFTDASMLPAILDAREKGEASDWRGKYKKRFNLRQLLALGKNIEGQTFEHGEKFIIQTNLYPQSFPAEARAPETKSRMFLLSTPEYIESIGTLHRKKKIWKSFVEVVMTDKAQSE